MEKKEEGYANGEESQLARVFDQKMEKLESALCKAIESLSEAIVRELREQRKTLIVPATSRTLPYALIAGLFLLLTLQTLKNSGKELEINRSGIKVKDSHSHEY